MSVSPPEAAAARDPLCLEAEGDVEEALRGEWIEEEARGVATVVDRASCLRTYELSTTATLRDGLPANPRRVTEQADGPRVRTRSPLFDALHALAMEETRECAVAAIRDGAFEEGEPMECPEGGCFETGRLWTYVWTRDTSYATDLGLAAVDPPRARNSLELKLSERRDGGDLQVVQDTGSGGSWPVSTDRVVWALGARAVLPYLDGEQHTSFRDRALLALRNTIEMDRAVAFDERTGLYRGEQSFLDWREQTYPPWTADDTVHVGTSMALSTNVAHLAALETAAELARDGRNDAAAEKYARWASTLRAAIHEKLWLDDAGMWSTFVPTSLDPGPARRFDLLGLSLAVLHDVGDASAARRAVASYPHVPNGAPVVWPQQQEPAIYHNRAIWPFVTAYYLRAARKVGNDAAADEAVRTLMRGAALNLSNMENFEMVTGAPYVEEGERSGPVVNSQRQLWSVAAYLSMVHHTIFGIEATGEGVRVAPYVTRWMRRELFADTDTLVLQGFRYRGRRLAVIVRLPGAGEGNRGAYAIGAMRVDGQEVGHGLVREEDLRDRSVIEIDLRDAGAPREPATITRVEAVEDREALFGPRTPAITEARLLREKVTLTLAVPDEEERSRITLRVYRDGVPVSGELPGELEAWTDASRGADDASACYSLEATYRSSGNASQRSLPSCWWGQDDRRAHVQRGRALVEADARATTTFRAARTGEHLVRLSAANGAGPINTGVTCAVRRIEVVDTAGDRAVASGYVMIPHGGLDAWDRFLPSSPIRADLESGHTYRITVAPDPRAANMSSFAHFERYTGGHGGREGPLDRIELDAIEILAR